MTDETTPLNGKCLKESFLKVHFLVLWFISTSELCYMRYDVCMQCLFLFPVDSPVWLPLFHVTAGHRGIYCSSQPSRIHVGCLVALS